MKFKIGDRVRFNPEDHHSYFDVNWFGTVIKCHPNAEDLSILWIDRTGKDRRVWIDELELQLDTLPVDYEPIIPVFEIQ